MAVSVPNMLYPFPELEIIRPCRVVGGSNLAANSIVRLVTGTNISGALLDDVAIGDAFGYRVIGVATDNYPTAADDGVDAGNVLPIVGVLPVATIDDGIGYVTFRGLVRQISCTVRSSGSATDVVFPANSVVFLDASNSYALTIAGPTTASGNSLEVATDDVIVGRTTEGFTHTSDTATTQVVDILWDGIGAFRAP